ncbi:MAG: hypothetical protein QOI16_4 [Pseudonocardiales bacterium]|nr:hypothetical protein [Pseudonocardiales bacterium]
MPDIIGRLHAVQIRCHGLSSEAERWLSVNVRRIVGFLFLALIVWLILTQPDAASGILRSIAVILRNAATNITHFFTTLLRG